MCNTGEVKNVFVIYHSCKDDKSSKYTINLLQYMRKTDT